VEMAAHSNGLHGLHGLHVSASHLQFIQLMQLALTIALLIVASIYIVRRLFFKKKESCESCEKR
jgi:flagellar biogenesis protein FliO